MALLPNYKDIVELLKKGSTIEAQEKIIELREGALSLQEENIKLRKKIRELESEVKIRPHRGRLWYKPRGHDLLGLS